MLHSLAQIKETLIAPDRFRSRDHRSVRQLLRSSLGTEAECRVKCQKHQQIPYGMNKMGLEFTRLLRGLTAMPTYSRYIYHIRAYTLGLVRGAPIILGRTLGDSGSSWQRRSRPAHL